MVFVSPEQAEDIRPANFLSWLFEEEPADPNKPLLIDANAPEANLSWSQIKQLVQQLAAGLRAQGLKRGDCLCIISQQSLTYLPAVYACIAAGAVFYGGSPRWTPAECVEFLAPIGVTHFLVDPPFIGLAEASLQAAGSDLSRIFVLADASADAPRTYAHAGRELATWSALLGYGTADWEEISDLETAQSLIALRLNTSGTTGVPKVAQLSHHCVIGHLNQWCHPFKRYAFEVKSIWFLGLERIGIFSFGTTAIKLHFPVYLLPYSVPGLLEACKRIQPTLAMIDPHSMVQLAKRVPPGSSELHCFRDIRLPGQDFPAAARDMVRAALHPDCMVSRPYGLTEVGTLTAVLYEQRARHDPAGVGFTFPGVQIKLVDGDGAEVTQHDTLGELLVKTPAVFTDYLANPDATARAFDRDGWFITGDVGYISAKTEQWYIIGRKDYLIKVRGTYVLPEEIESMLVCHPDIEDAAVAPVTVQGQKNPLIRAFVARKVPGGGLTEENVAEFVRQRLAPEQMITGGVAFVKAIPRTVIKKVIRYKLPDLEPEDAVAPVNGAGGVNGVEELKGGGTGTANGLGVVSGSE